MPLAETSKGPRGAARIVFVQDLGKHRGPAQLSENSDPGVPRQQLAMLTEAARIRYSADALMASPNVDRLNIGPIPTFRIGWDQPHEGNLFEHLYRQRAFQIEPAA